MDRWDLIWSSHNGEMIEDTIKAPDLETAIKIGIETQHKQGRTFNAPIAYSGPGMDCYNEYKNGGN